MKHVPEVEETINEDLSEIRDPAEDDVQRNNRYFGILWRNGTVGAGVFDDVAADTLHTHLRKSFSRFCYLFRYLERIHWYCFARLRPTVLRITAKNSPAVEKEIISMVWRDSGDT